MAMISTTLLRNTKTELPNGCPYHISTSRDAITLIINTKSRLHVPPPWSSASKSTTTSSPSRRTQNPPPITTSPPLPQPPSHVYPAILLANRQINWEATPFLYSSNMFVAHPTLLATFPRLRNWYPPLREAKTLVPLIHRFHIQVRLDLPLQFDRKAAAESFSGLDELSIDLVQSMFLGVDCNNLAVFDAVRGVKTVYISGSTTGFEHYIAWLVNAMTSPMGAEVAPYEPEADSPWAHIWSGHASLVKSSIPQIEKQE
ncbi:hypothetical protein TrVGV298_011711 [Trichoderma virens]|nr:hypothetical protein TrVGV298_011711 [Trichoderma virens]